MARFYFNSEDGECFRDQEGTDLPDLAAAERDGIKIFGELVLNDPELFLTTETFRIIIQDQQRLTLYVIETSRMASRLLAQQAASQADRTPAARESAAAPESPRERPSLEGNKIHRPALCEPRSSAQETQ